jgi:hypothetical protein
MLSAQRFDTETGTEIQTPLRLAKELGIRPGALVDRIDYHVTLEVLRSEKERIWPCAAAR